MNKMIKIVALLLISTIFTACGSKLPFKEQTPLENAALVYVYVPSEISGDEDTDETDYNLRINNKRVMERISSGEYMVFNLKPITLTLSATRAQVEEHKLSVSLNAGEVYYFKISGKLDGGNFSFDRVSKAVGSKEITKTGLAGSSVEDEENIITEFINPKSEEDAQVKVAPVAAVPTATVASTPVATQTPTRGVSSKMDDIKQAYEMKNQGMLSDEEFKALKAEILAK